MGITRVSYADQVREHARSKYVVPARASRQDSVRIEAGEVQKGVHLTNRVALVCQALKSHKFLDENGLLLEKWEGPPSGMSTTVSFTYRFREGASHLGKTGPADWPFSDLRGVAKDVFDSLGGGEAFIRGARESFYGPGRDY